MTSHDAMHGGADHGLKLEKNWPGLGATDADLYYDVGKMRAVANELENQLATMAGPGATKDGGTGSVEALTRYFTLDASHIGTWQAASALAQSVGSPGETPSGMADLEGRGERLGLLYKEYYDCLETLVKALRECADTYERTNPTPNRA
ncbi:hypothetical protein [Nonomuraea sp. LPB2021202275-12-8]|uniref:hypothetical protein n=1 Tax=Nonomuraea sp. LPB2021202275-12-8 TaxID=3120159 RepID=UPI00300D2940